MESFSQSLPNKILRADDMAWNVSGAFVHDDTILSFIKKLHDLFDIINPIASVHGSPKVIWNAGRPGADVTKNKFDATIKIYADIGIPLYLTWSNHLLDMDDLNNLECNYILDQIAEIPHNGVIVASDLLSKYIHDKYPNLKQIASVIKTTHYDGERDATYYDNLTSRFDRVVIHMDDNVNFDLLRNIQAKDKCEILVNETCVLNCHFRRVHNIGNAELSKYNYSHLTTNNVLANCFTHSQNILKLHVGEANHSRRRICTLTDTELTYIYKLGYRQFKLQGRDCQKPKFLYFLCKYILEPEIIAPMVYHELLSRDSESIH